MIKLQDLFPDLASVVSEVRQTFPMIPTRFLTMKGLRRIEVVYYFGKRVVKCRSENGINDRINALNWLINLSAPFDRQGYKPEFVTLVFDASRGHLVDCNQIVNSPPTLAD